MVKRKQVQKDKQRSTKHTYEIKDRVTRTSLKPGVNSGAPEGQAVPAPLMIPVKSCKNRVGERVKAQSM